MATLYSDIATKQLDTVNKRQGGLKVTGNVCMAVATYTLTASEVANDIINLVKLPAGAMVLPHLSKVIAENPGTQLTLQIGDDLDTPDVDKYSGTLDISAGGKFDLVEGATVGGLTPAALSDEAWVTAKVIAQSSLTADQTVTFYIAYNAVS